MIADRLADLGADRVFGVVGDALNPITDAIRTTEGTDWTAFPHEEAAAFAAGAWPRRSG
ncbi:thiamine pyrophosphate-binding protein [Streptomyces sp. NPDC004267]|uniref:thiamine pyrophosphate-binding protein n=1 Tax=Streptomyces sp. NPDC004267 TaxID=3364694 RepID=UPI0036A36A00